MSYVRLYPGGVINTDIKRIEDNVSDKKLIIQRPDEEIIALYKERNASYIRNESFEFKKKVITCAIRLYGNFYPWLDFQLKRNRFIHDLNQEFLIDTLKFIKTGERSMMLHMWENLLEQYPDTLQRKQPITDLMTLEYLENIDYVENPFSDYIVEWTTQKDGFYDMLYTTYLLFGKADNVTLNKFNLLTNT